MSLKPLEQEFQKYLPGFRVTGGRCKSKSLTTELKPAVYAGIKVFIWHDMLKQGRVPTKWQKPTSRGTFIHFDYADSKEEIDKAVQALREYIDEVNRDYNLGIELVPQQDGGAA